MSSPFLTFGFVGSMWARLRWGQRWLGPISTVAYFTDTTGHVATDFHDSAGWHGPLLVGGTSSGPISVDEDGSALLFTNTSKQVVTDWHDSTGWHGPNALEGSSNLPVTLDAAGTAAYFIDLSGNVVTDFHDSTGWHGPDLLN